MSGVKTITLSPEQQQALATAVRLRFERLETILLGDFDPYLETYYHDQIALLTALHSELQA